MIKKAGKSGESRESEKFGSSAIHNQDVLMYVSMYVSLAGILLFLLAITLGVASQFSSQHITDDAYMWVRYADNVVEHRGIAWNKGVHTYGLTSLLYLAITVIIRLFTEKAPLICNLSSTISGIIFLGLMMFFVTKFFSKNTRLLIMSFLLFAFTINYAESFIHMVSGMDTMFAMAFLMLYLILASWFEKKQTTNTLLTTGVVGGIAYYVRPDLMIFTVGMPGISIVLNYLRKDKKSRKKLRSYLLLLATTIVTFSIELVIASLYFGTPFPLPFYAKVVGLYGPTIIAAYKGIGPTQLLLFLKHYWFVIALPILWVLVDTKKWWQTSSDTFKSSMVAAAVFMTYYSTSVLQIMFHRQRFYYPLVSVLFFLAAFSIRGLIAWSARDKTRKEREKIKKVILWISILLTITALFFVYKMGVIFRNNLEAGLVGDFDIWKEYETNPLPREVWFALDNFSRLPDDLIIGSTEVGMLGAMNPEKKIIDLAGLQETDIAMKRISVLDTIKKYKIDLVYLPHHHYKENLKIILSDKEFLETYTIIPQEKLGPVLLAIAVRKDSKYYGDIMNIVNKESPWILVTSDSNEYLVSQALEE